jgi:hypothetical protein
LQLHAHLSSIVTYARPPMKATVCDSPEKRNRRIPGGFSENSSGWALLQLNFLRTHLF